MPSDIYTVSTLPKNMLWSLFPVSIMVQPRTLDTFFFNVSMSINILLLKKQNVWSILVGVWKNCICDAKQLFFSLFHYFLEQPSLFSNVHAHPELVQPQGRTNKTFFLNKIKKYVFCWAFFGETMAHLLHLFLHPFVHFFQVLGSNFTRNPSATSGSLAWSHRVQRTQ